MKNLRILIIEDEKPAARSLQRKLEKHGYLNPDMLHSVAQMRRWFAENAEPDLIFMDIQLSDGLSFDALQDLDLQSSIIFTTAYDQFAIRAFEHNSIDYLLKPIHPEKLEAALKKFERHQRSSESISLNTLRAFFVEDPAAYKTRFTIKIGASLKLVEVIDVECIYAENKAIYLYTKYGDNYLLDYNLEQLDQLLNPKEFFRINRSQIIQRCAMDRISIHSNSRFKIYLRNYTSNELIVSRERMNLFKEWLE
ncbi:LytTR family DNA-binding domain-containing protein [Sphingobacterium oryzagri]|uniref:LytTR family DNA-binding domain-containing protein n=1 Tax=Sphingobacterium oryzagri TaxID=3025669 RepID=A0ABY7WFP1_9SPHI|nr:LytTR family DNA-binding domain-containing protein [Sphingobacterium sp. KACC 22765]WDF67434.1 LytTR family DNA-binding domain-containing protein [Sphingobacterium sp. KACC 22765]